jgi:hypothetical protein
VPGVRAAAAYGAALAREELSSRLNTTANDARRTASPGRHALTSLFGGSLSSMDANLNVSRTSLSYA